MDYFNFRQGLIWLMPTYYTLGMIKSRFIHREARLLTNKTQFLHIVVGTGMMIFISSMLKVFWGDANEGIGSKLGTGLTVLIIVLPLLAEVMKQQGGDKKDFYPTFFLNIIIILGSVIYELSSLDRDFQGYFPYTVVMMFIQLFSLMIGGFMMATANLEFQRFIYYVIYPVFIYFIDVKMYDFALKYQGGAFFNP